MAKGRLMVVTIVAALTGCGDGDGVEWTTDEEFIDREALCVAYSERFDLRAAVNRHNDHLDDALRYAWQTEQRENNRADVLYGARHWAGIFSKQGMALFLQDNCNTTMMQWQYDAAPNPLPTPE